MRLLLCTSVTSFNIPFTQKHSSSLSWNCKMAGFCKSMTTSRVVYYLHNNKNPSLGGLLCSHVFASSHNFLPCGKGHCITKYGCVEDYRSGTFYYYSAKKNSKVICSSKLLPAPSQIKNNWPWNKMFFFFLSVSSPQNYPLLLFHWHLQMGQDSCLPHRSLTRCFAWPSALCLYLLSAEGLVRGHSKEANENFSIK